jgi:hypothetical protein
VQGSKIYPNRAGQDSATPLPIRTSNRILLSWSASYCRSLLVFALVAMVFLSD